MDGDNRVLRFQFMGRNVDVSVDVEKSNILDVVMDFEDKARELCVIPPKNPEFTYVWKMKHWKIETDIDLMNMFERLHGHGMIYIWVASVSKPSKLNQLVLQLRSSLEQEVSVSDAVPNVGDKALVDVPTPTEVLPSFTPQPEVIIMSAKEFHSEQSVTHRSEKLPTRGGKGKVAVDGEIEQEKFDRVDEHFKQWEDIQLVDKDVDEEEPYNGALDWTLGELLGSDVELEDPKSLQKFLREKEKEEREFRKQKGKGVVICDDQGKLKKKGCQGSKKTGQKDGGKSKSLTQAEKSKEKGVGTSGQHTQPAATSKQVPGTPVAKTASVPRRSPRLTKTATVQGGEAREVLSQHRPNESLYAKKIPRSTAVKRGLFTGKKRGEADLSGTRESEDSSEDESYKCSESEDNSSEDDNGKCSESDLLRDEMAEDFTIPTVEDKWRPHQWHDFNETNANDDDYFCRLYANGELYEEQVFGGIVLRPWMIFTEKSHFKETLKDYCIQEGFSIIVLWTDATRYTATCASAQCEWRIHASRLPDGRTWAIKKITPNFHTCRGLETHNPLCTVKWAASKMIEDIRANPDIKGKELNNLMFKRYGLYMKKSSLYNMKNMVIKEMFGGHDKSYGLLPAYIKVIHETNPGSVAFASYADIGDPQKSLQFSQIFISFAGAIKGFTAGCRSLIGVDGTHLKGNFGGILLSAIGMDGNNELFPLAYAVVSIENEDNWAYFLWHLYNIVKECGRDNWTIISDRQKGVDLALKKVWPKAHRRYCCRHLSRNFKKEFPGPLMYILFWRACNATNPYTFKKAMERLRKEGKSVVMLWFAKLGKQSKWTKHKFNTSVCSDINTSNFVESFNSTLGIERCRPILTMLEGIRRVCMVRLATRQQNAQEWDDNSICPKIVKLVKDIGKATRFCTSHISAPGEFEIHEGKSQFPLSLNKHKCGCGAWQLSGVPCRHAIRAVIASKLDPHDFVSDWFSVKKYKATYSNYIAPIADPDQWPEYESLPTVLPPPMKRGVGRPSRNRKREEGEEAKGKRSKTIKCKNCGHLGHNKRTCKGGPTANELAHSEPIVTRNKRKGAEPKDAASKSKKTKKNKHEEINASGSQPHMSLSQIDV